MKRFEPMLEKARPWLMPYITAGYPKAEETLGLMQSLEQGGADVIELGLPFSDPLADGPVIQAASQKALDAGINHSRILEILTSFRKQSDLPVILMGYLNPILAYGSDRFFENAAQAGADGLIIPDLPVEEAVPYLEPARKAGLSWVFLAAPTSSLERLKRVDEESDVWSYCVSVAGVTGARKELPSSVGEYLERMKSQATKPFVVGFGISTQAHIREVCPPARGVVVGSALLRALSEESSASGRRQCAEGFMKNLSSSSS